MNTTSQVRATSPRRPAAKRTARVQCAICGASNRDADYCDTCTTRRLHEELVAAWQERHEAEPVEAVDDDELDEQWERYADNADRGL